MSPWLVPYQRLNVAAIETAEFSRTYGGPAETKATFTFKPETAGHLSRMTLYGQYAQEIWNQFMDDSVDRSENRGMMTVAVPKEIVKRLIQWE